MKEIWTTHEDYPGYEFSNYGEVRRHDGIIIAQSLTHDGTLKVHVQQYGSQVTRSVRVLIASVFVEKLDERCTTVINLDGDQHNNAAPNLAWRPRWFAWQYTHQFTRPANDRYHVPVQNMHTGQSYSSVVDAGMAEGLLFKDVYRSAVTGSLCYPTGVRFEAL